MPRCSVCIHPNRKKIDAALAANATPLRRVAAEFSLTESSLRRHRDRHLPAKIAASAEARRVRESDDLGEQLRELRGKAADLLLRAEQSGDLRTALMATRELRNLVETMAKATGQLGDASTSVSVNVAVDTDAWPRLQLTIMQTLESFPDAKIAVADALQNEARR